MSNFERISVNEAENIIRENDVLVLDMRDFQSYSVSHYPKALHLDDANLRMLLKHTSREVPIMVYCYHGNSSQEMAKLFSDFGFKKSYSVDGGYDAWLQSSNLAKELAALQASRIQSPIC